MAIAEEQRIKEEEREIEEHASWQQQQQEQQQQALLQQQQQRALLLQQLQLKVESKPVFTKIKTEIIDLTDDSKDDTPRIKKQQIVKSEYKFNHNHHQIHHPIQPKFEDCECGQPWRKVDVTSQFLF